MGMTLRGLFGSPTRKVVLLTIILAVGLAVGKYAYYASVPSPETAGPSVSITSPPLQLSLSLDKAEYLTKDNMSACFSLRNISNRTVSVTKTRYWAFGHEPLLFSVYEVTTSAEGVSSNHLEQFQFRLIWVDSNGTVVADLPNQLISFPVVYDISLEPNGCLNQTLRISISDYFEATSLPLQTGAFQIRGLLSDVTLDEASQSTVTLETPSIAFTIN